jgi:hypothetical protein
VTSKTFDYAQRLPEVVGDMVDTNDPRRPFFTWTAPPAIDGAAKGGIARLDVDTGTRTVRWSFVVAPNAKNVRAPALPSPAADDWISAPDAAAPTVRSPGILFVDGSSLANYSAFRVSAGLVFAPGAKLLFAGIPNGTFRVTRWLEPPPS